ncbi:MAG: alpha/beta fold hydrolase [Candidatus Diapherotrites archaeon]|nr:alpha/beta fold hydrolase [Candidatus Diapherotrites archaeon]
MFKMHEHFFAINSFGEKISGILHFPVSPGKDEVGFRRNPDKIKKGKFPVVVFVPGFTAPKNSWHAVNFFPAILEKGFAFVGFDFSGLGESEGKFEETTVSKQIADLKAVVEFLKKDSRFDSERIALIGSSLGGFDSLLFASQNKIKALVLLAPLSKFVQEINEFVIQGTIAEWKKKGHAYAFPLDYGQKFKINYSFFEDGLSKDVYAIVPKISCPTLVIHGSGDAIVPLAQSEKLFNSLACEKEFLVLDGANHLFTNNGFFPRVLEASVNWIKKHL